jgi:hypothetical protein
LIPGPNFIKEKGIKWQLQPSYLGGKKRIWNVQQSCPKGKGVESPNQVALGTNFLRKNGIKWWIMREKRIFPMEKVTKW